MHFAHIGVAVFILGVSFSEGMKTYYQGVKSLKSKLSFRLYNKYSKLEKLNEKTGFLKKELLVAKMNKEFEMKAERRIYLDTGMPSTEAAIKRNFFSHLYIVMGQEQPEGSGKRIVRVYHNPHIILIWLGAVIMALGGLFSLLDYRKSLFKIIITFNHEIT